MFHNAAIFIKIFSLETLVFNQNLKMHWKSEGKRSKGNREVTHKRTKAQAH